MSFKTFMANLGATAKEKSPEILVGFGLLSIGAGIFFACKATLEIDKQKEELKGEIDEAVESAKEKFEEIDEGVESEVLENYDETCAQKDKAIVYKRTAGSVIKTGFKVGKAYAPAAGFIVCGFACILLSHKILRDRNATLLAAYTALDAAFKAYRARVIKDGGKELDAKYLYGTKTEVKETTRVNPETGLEETVVESEEVIDYPLGSPYARIWDKEHVKGFVDADPNYDWNRTFLKQQQEYANTKLSQKGYLFLNEVYTMLGLEPSPEGQIVGWVKGNKDGDGYIDFNIDLTYTDPRFKGLIEPDKMRRKIVLDFNVDGPILDKIGWKLKGKNDLSQDELYELDLMTERSDNLEELPDSLSNKYDEMELERYAFNNK